MINEDDEHALTVLRHEQAVLLERVRDLDEQRRLHERLSYSRYYLDMQLNALREELTLCQYRLRHLERTISQAAKVRASQRSVASVLRAEEASRHFGPALSAFVVSILALVAAGLLYAQRFSPPAVAPTSTPSGSALVVTTPTPTRQPTATTVPTPTPPATVFAVNQTDGLNVRRAAGTSAPVLRILKRGVVVQLTGDQADADGKVWYQLKDGGWVVSDFFKLYSTQAEADAAVAALPR